MRLNNESDIVKQAMKMYREISLRLTTETIKAKAKYFPHSDTQYISTNDKDYIDSVSRDMVDNFLQLFSGLNPKDING